MIETGRLLMRPFGADDAELLNQLYADEEIMRYMPFDLEVMEASRARLERILRDWQADPVMNYEFAVIRKDTGEKIGRSHI
ncbi:MAG: GNAT family N-acetyltransferase, partial [Solobacterium sp.]|nr:GNAT family N-acetyltransferase [Solobacterium sp.]